MEQILVLKFIRSFFRLFQAHLEDYKILDKSILGIVGWKNEEDKQSFIYTNDYDPLLLTKSKYLCDYLNAQNLINGDQIIILETELIQRLNLNGWSEIDAMEAINFLCQFDIKMIDNSEETDSFFVHF